MKKKIIFTTLAFALIGLFGFSFSQNGQQTKQVNAVAQRKNAKLNAFSESDLNNNNYYYFVAKNYENNGEGVFYQGDINIANSAICPSTNGSLRSVVQFTRIRDTAMYGYSLSFNNQLSGGVYRLSACLLTNYDGSYEGNFIYYASANSGYFTRSNCAFLCTQLFIRDNVSNTIAYINQFFNVYVMNSGQFTFDSQINYYAPYGQDIDTYFVNDSNMTSPSSSITKTILENTPFYSGGLVFDTIRLRYFNAQALTYYDDNGNRQVWTADSFASYSWIEYVNSVTNRIIVVNQRITQAWNQDNASGVVQLKGSKWIANDYKSLQFFVTPTNQQTTILSTLNNSSYQGNTYIGNTTDIGIGGAFGLISQAFTAWLPILSVSVLPGITLGMLIFLPLIAGIIILIIWIVKR